MDFKAQKVITRDNVEIQVHPMILYRLFDPCRVAYETYDLAHAVQKLVQTTIRSIIGDMGLDDTLASREEIQRLLMFKICKTCQNWGCRIENVELLEIAPGDRVQAAMHKQLAAERTKRAMVVSANGVREKMKTRAEGYCQSQIALATGAAQVSVQNAKGLAEARVLIAKAEAGAVETIAKELKPFGVNPTQYLIGLRYIDTFAQISRDALHRKIYFPYETDTVGALRDLGHAPTAASARAF
jgi:regulator of protease activity HflC (stomatin/prohibitin superfamily)